MFYCHGRVGTNWTRKAMNRFVWFTEIADTLGSQVAVWSWSLEGRGHTWKPTTWSGPRTDQIQLVISLTRSLPYNLLFWGSNERANFLKRHKNHNIFPTNIGDLNKHCFQLTKLTLYFHDYSRQAHHLLTTYKYLKCLD